MSEVEVAQRIVTIECKYDNSEWLFLERIRPVTLRPTRRRIAPISPTIRARMPSVVTRRPVRTDSVNSKRRFTVAPPRSKETTARFPFLFRSPRRRKSERTDLPSRRLEAFRPPIAVSSRRSLPRRLKSPSDRRVSIRPPQLRFPTKYHRIVISVRFRFSRVK